MGLDAGNRNISDSTNMTATDNQMNVDAPLLCNCEGLNFEYFGKKILMDINFTIEAGEKILLIGANGAGKSTLLRVLGGLHLSFDHKKFDVLGTARPNDQHRGLAYMGNRWQNQVNFSGTLPHMADIAAGDMLADWQEENRQRRDELVELLGIDLRWRMHQVSDGQRKKVQIMLALLKPFQLALIDEFVSELDVVVRNRLYMYLDKEVEERQGGILYASHVFDQLDLHFDSVVCINNGTLGAKVSMEEFMTKWTSDSLMANIKIQSKVKRTPAPSLFMAVYHKLRQDEIDGTTLIEQPTVMSEGAFQGSGYGSGRGVFVEHERLVKDEIRRGQAGEQSTYAKMLGR